MPRKPEYEPTPEEIEKGLAKIRRGWSPAQKKSRNKLPKETPYDTPVYKVTKSHVPRDSSLVFTRIG